MKCMLLTCISNEGVEYLDEMASAVSSLANGNVVNC